MATSTTPVSFEPVEIDPSLGLTAEPQETSQEASSDRPRRAVRWDWGLVVGFSVVAAAVVFTGRVSAAEAAVFFQPQALALVIGGTLGASLVTTPGLSVATLFARLRAMLTARGTDRRVLAEEILRFVRVARLRGLLQLEASAGAVENPVLREGLLLAIDGIGREEISAALELQLRTLERRAETDARVLESAGGFAPAIGVMGTVLGLLDVMRNFSDLPGVAAGVGTAFVSTLYGLALANFVLLPMANRVRAKAAQACETGEMALVGVLCLRDGLPPRLIRERLEHYVAE